MWVWEVGGEMVRFERKGGGCVRERSETFVGQTARLFVSPFDARWAQATHDFGEFWDRRRKIGLRENVEGREKQDPFDDDASSLSLSHFLFLSSPTPPTVRRQRAIDKSKKSEAADERGK